jgi:hypothetical protein
MNMMKSLQAERLIAKQYEERGYVVTLGPPPSRIPFPLGDHIPDILATKGSENILIEVKAPGARTDSDSYFRLDQQAQQHPGWQFMLVTVSDDELQQSASSFTSDVSVESIREILRNLDGLVDDAKMSGLVLPGLWMAYVFALRILALEEHVETDGYTDLSLINRAYSEGIVSIEEYETARRLMTLRNQAVHSLKPTATPADCKLLRQMADTLLDRLPASLASAQTTNETSKG